MSEFEELLHHVSAITTPSGYVERQKQPSRFLQARALGRTLYLLLAHGRGGSHPEERGISPLSFGAFKSLTKVGLVGCKT